jgi:hypothetical protein
MAEQHRISYVKTGGGGIAYGPIDPGLSYSDGYVWISALNLWQNGPISVGLNNYDVLYIVEVTCFTVSDPYYPFYPNDSGAYGTGATRRVGAFRLSDGYDGDLTVISQSDIEWLGGQIYPEFYAGYGNITYSGNDPVYQPEIGVRFLLAYANGYYMHNRYYIKIEAYESGTTDHWT